jgi:hypothetical protein
MKKKLGIGITILRTKSERAREGGEPENKKIAKLTEKKQTWLSEQTNQEEGSTPGRSDPLGQRCQ